MNSIFNLGGNMDIFKLQRPFRNMRWKINAISKDKTKCMIVPYIDSRDVQERLDMVVGPDSWYDVYSEYGNGGITCSLCICVGEDWVCKSDIGAYTIQDKKDGHSNKDVKPDEIKGSASDAFKRAAVKWGIGRYLYSIEGIWLPYDSTVKRPVIDGDILWDIDSYGNDIYIQQYKQQLDAVYKDITKKLQKIRTFKNIDDAIESVFAAVHLYLYADPSSYWKYQNEIITALRAVPDKVTVAPKATPKKK